MDLIGEMAGRLGLDTHQAQALAGTVMGALQRQAPDEEAEKLQQAVPEMNQWQAQASQMVSAPQSGMGGLLSAAAGALGGQQGKDLAAIVNVLDQFGVDASKGAMVAPMVLDFLKERLDDQVLSNLLAAAPMLAAAAREHFNGDGDAPQPPAAEDDGFGMDDAAQMLGSLFGKKS